MKVTTNIDGYEVEVEDESTDNINCWVTRKFGNSTYSASLAALQADGLLAYNSVNRAVAVETVDKITTWAEAQGY